jgi:hypothetical protein
MHYDNPIGRFSGEVFLSATVNVKTRFVLNTTKYVCEQLEGRSESLSLRSNDNLGLRMEVSDIALQPEQDYFQAQLERFVGAIHGWCDVPVDGRFGAMSVQLIEEMYRNRRQLDEPWLSYRARLQEESLVQG